MLPEQWYIRDYFKINNMNDLQLIMWACNKRLEGFISIKNLNAVSGGPSYLNNMGGWKTLSNSKKNI